MDQYRCLLSGFPATSSVEKDGKGNITSIEGTDLGKDEVIKLGAGIGALLGLGAGGMEGAKVGAKAGAEFAAEVGFGYSIDDIMNLGADEIPNNSSALIMLVEHLWAKSIKDALRNSGAVMISQGMLQPEAIVLMGAALAEAEKKKKMENELEKEEIPYLQSTIYK
jgi:uncharacterized membrane protein